MSERKAQTQINPPLSATSTRAMQLGPEQQPSKQS
jgi:hypothetical protein